jgi:hypothetical protein
VNGWADLRPARSQATVDSSIQPGWPAATPAGFTGAGFVERAYGPAGGLWLVPTRKGLHYAGLEFAAWSLAGWKAAHLAAVCRMRLHLERQYPGAGWESERQCRARWHGTGARVRIPDGILGQPGRRIGIEVELHRKAAHRYEAILADLDPELAEVWWFVGGRDVVWLGRVLADIPCAVPQRVVELPEGWPGEPAGGAGAPPGLRPVPGGVPALTLALVCWAAAQGVLKVTGWPRWRVGAAAVAGGAAVIWLQGGPVPALAATSRATWAS